MDKRKLIHEKLETMKYCYKQRNLENLDLIYGTFFSDDHPAVLLGTDNGELFQTKEQIYELFSYDWQYWGDVSIDTWGFTTVENGPYTLARVKALLDFHEDRAWDIDILMVFEECDETLVCRLMMFKVPRNIIRPTVIINHSKDEMDKYEAEQRDFKTQFDKIAGTVFPESLQTALPEMLCKQISEQRPDWADVTIPEKQIIAFYEDGKHFYFASTGVCKSEDGKDVLPFRIIGLGETDGSKATIVDSELSRPFFTTLG